MKPRRKVINLCCKLQQTGEVLASDSSLVASRQCESKEKDFRTVITQSTAICATTVELSLSIVNALPRKSMRKTTAGATGNDAQGV